MKYVCDVCGYEYDEELGDPDNGIAPGTKFEDLPDDYACPLCGVGKDSFSATTGRHGNPGFLPPGRTRAVSTPAPVGSVSIFSFLPFFLLPWKLFL